MNFSITLSFIAAILSLALGVFVFLRDRHSFVHRLFAVGIMALSLESGLSGLSFWTTSASELVYWQRLKLMVGSFLPGIWLIFSLSFGRANYREFLSRWKWILLASFILPLFPISVFGDSFFVGGPITKESFVVFLRLGWPGYAYCLFSVIGAVLILMNLERTLRHSTGYMRWQIKFIVLGLGSLFGARIYVTSQTLLFKSLNLNLEIVNIGALVVACVLILKALFRTGLFNVDFYVSQSFLYNSFTILFVGIYLLSVGILARFISYLEGAHNLPLEAFFVFLALLGLVILLLSDRLRKRMKWFISRHFNRPLYDYRNEWTKFTQRTTCVTEIKDLCSIVTKMVSELLDILSVTIWLVDETAEGVKLGGSTVFSERQLQELCSVKKDVGDLIRFIRQAKPPIDFDYSKDAWPKESNGSNGKFFLQTRIRYCFPLIARGRFLGIMTLGDRVMEDSLSIENFELLKTIADQTASSLFNLRLSADLRQAKEMEVFQTMSAFFMHDLKNLASNLSLTLQNLPIHFDNPDFRNDVVQTITRSVNKINGMCSRLSSLNKKLELHRTQADLNELIGKTASSLDGSLKAPLIMALNPVTKLFLDWEQMQKVLVNLILNANEATTDGGEIEVATMPQDNFVVLSVSDNGCGMSQEFIAQSLFRPLKTTKKNGMGIGLYQTKMIVEAHGGKVEVESEEGKGTTMRVLLPINRG
jgi:putative PEP-CTERM system histidine kinase